MDDAKEAAPLEVSQEEKPLLLIVDDEPVIREVLSDFLVSQGYVVQTAENGAVALEALKQNRFHLVMTDLKMPVMGGAELIAELAARNMKATIIVMTAYATVETAINTMKNGAYDYIMKPFKIDEITVVVERALQKEQLERENIQLKETQKLYQISEAMNSSLSQDKVLPIIVQSAKQETDAAVASLVLWDSEKELWCSEICDTDIVNISPRELDEALDLTALHEAHASGKPILYPSVDVKPYLKKGLKNGEELRSFLSVPLVIKGEVKGMLNVFSFHRGQIFLEGQRKSLFVLASRAANAIENARLHEELKATFLQTIEGFAHALDAKDPYTHGHSRRVTSYCEQIALAMGLDMKEVERIRHAATLHDIGKIGLKLESLNKPGKLNQDEAEVFRTHPKMGTRILGPIRFFDNLIPIIYHHHEHYDGSGYPEGKRGDEIPMGARILSVADAYDAMTSDRPYRQAMTMEEAVAELLKNMDTQFDPRVVDVFVRILSQGEPGGKGKPVLEAQTRGLSS